MNAERDTQITQEHLIDLLYFQYKLDVLDHRLNGAGVEIPNFAGEEVLGESLLDIVLSILGFPEDNTTDSDVPPEEMFCRDYVQNTSRESRAASTSASSSRSTTSTNKLMSVTNPTRTWCAHS